MKNKLRYGIVGAGAAGCALAWHLTGRGHEVHVFEKWEDVGGLASDVPFGETRLDRFYHHIFTSDAHILAFIERLGLQDKLHWCSSSVGFEHGGKLYPFTTPADLLRFSPISLLSRVRVGLSVLKAKRIKDYRELEGITAEEWIIREMGADAYRVLWEPLLRSKFGGRYREVSAVWFWGKVKLRGGTRSKSGAGECLGYLEDGWAQVYQRMREEIERRGGAFHFREMIEEIGEGPDGPELKSRKGAYAFDRVIATPGAGAFLEMVPSLPEEYRSNIAQIPHQANITMILGLDRSVSPFYWLNITDPESPFVAVIEHANLFPDPKYGGLKPVYLSRYLSEDDPLFSMGSNKLREIFLAGLERKIPGFEPGWVKSFTCSKARNTQPVIGLHYSKKRPAFETPMPGLFLCAMSQIYPEDRGMNYSIRIAEELLVRLGELDRLSA